MTAMMTWRNCCLVISGLTTALLLGPVMAFPLSSDDAATPKWESGFEQTANRQSSAGGPGVISSPPESSLKPADSLSESSQLASQPSVYRQRSETDAAEHVAAPLHDTVNSSPSASHQAFWRHADQSRQAVSSELPAEISVAIDDLQRGIAETIADATGMRVDSDGQRRLSLGGIEIFMGPQGGGIAISHGDLSQSLVDYDSRRSDAELAMLVAQDASGNGKVAVNPLLHLVQWLKEILSYPLFWVFVISLIVGYIAAMLIRQRGLKRAQELYSKSAHHPTSVEIERPRSRTRSKYPRPASASGTLQSTTRPTTEAAKGSVQPKLPRP